MKKGIYHFGRYLLLMARMFSVKEKPSVYWSLVMREAVNMGIGSMAIVVIISVFTGAVTTVQTAYQLTTGLIPPSTIGTIVSASALLELAPTITSLILAGRIGSYISSEIGTMRVTEQIDALEVMGINSASYLILPKILGALLAFPCLIIVAAFLIHVGGMVAGDMTGEVNYDQFAQGVRDYFNDFQVTFMLIKSFAFGLIISTIAAYHGYYVDGGALEVGEASTRAVVYSCIILVLADYVLAQLLL